MEVLKTFVRQGKRYRPGDDPPPELDAPTVAHYQRHGMLGKPAASAAPASGTRLPTPRQQRTPKTVERKPAAPQQAPLAAPAVVSGVASLEPQGLAQTDTPGPALGEAGSTQQSAPTDGSAPPGAMPSDGAGHPGGAGGALDGGG